jgi:hypothetical protein
VDLQVNGSGPALAGGDDSHRDLLTAGPGDARHGPGVRRPTAQQAPGRFQTLEIGQVGLRLIASRRLGGGVEGTALLDVSDRCRVDQVGEPDFHHVPISLPHMTNGAVSVRARYLVSRLRASRTLRRG